LSSPHCDAAISTHRSQLEISNAASGSSPVGANLTSHLRSARTAKKKRELRRPEILFEGHARNMRKLMGISGNHPSTHRNKARKTPTAAGAKA